MNYPKVYAITLSYDRKEDTIEFLESLKKMTYPNYEILVVENGSSDDSAKAIKEKFPEVSLIEIKKNVGYSRGFNIGLEFAYTKGADYFLILNNDTVVDPEALTELVETAQRYDDTGFVTGKVYFYKDPSKIQTAGRFNDGTKLVGGHVGWGEDDVGQCDEEKKYDFVDDVFLLVKKEVYEKIGGYDESFFIAWEEADWCVRVRRAGFKIFYSPKAKIRHKGNLTTSDGVTYATVYYRTRNQIPFMWRHARLHPRRL